jgi:hypothetical protein
LNKKLKGKIDKYRSIINDVYESIINKSTGSLQGIHWETQQHLGWDCCIRGFLSTELLEISRLRNLEKSDFKIIGWIIITLWKTWNKAWKARNRKFKEKDQYLAQIGKMQHIVDINIIYHCQEYLTDELNRQLKSSIEGHLSQSNTSIDAWLIMFKSITYLDVIKIRKYDKRLKIISKFIQQLKTTSEKTQLEVRILKCWSIFLKSKSDLKNKLFTLLIEIKIAGIDLKFIIVMILEKITLYMTHVEQMDRTSSFILRSKDSPTQW